MKNISKEKSDLSSKELERYSRHIVLPEIGITGQKKLKNSSVLCIGCGGLGSPVLLYLAASGIGRIGIVEDDVVEESNLQRQVIHDSKSIGKSKIKSAYSRILDINPNSKVEAFPVSINNNNALEIIKNYDIVCDCTDNFKSRYLINDACVILGKPNIYGSVSMFEGQASVFNLGKDSPNFRDLVPVPPPMELLPSCNEAGVLGVIPGIIGIIQATEVIKIVTGIGSTLNGRILVFDGLNMKFKELNLKKSKTRKKIKSLINYEEFCSSKNFSKKVSVSSITPSELKDLIKSQPSKNILLDVRSEREYHENSIEGSILIPLQNIEEKENIEKIRELSRAKSLYIHCKTGKRSHKAIIKLKEYGIDAINLKGGINAWNKE